MEVSGASVTWGHEELTGHELNEHKGFDNCSKISICRGNTKCHYKLTVSLQTSEDIEFLNNVQRTRIQ